MSHSMLGDELLAFLQRSSRGDKDAFNQLYQRTSSRMFAIALRLLHRKDWAEETVQEAYVKIWHNAGDYLSERGSVQTWMITILRYRAIDRLRKEKSHLLLPADAAEEPVMESSSVDTVDLHQSIDRLQGCMQELEDAQRQCIAGAYFDGLTHAQLSTHMGTPLGTVKSWIRRGLLLLRRCLER